MAGGAAAGGRYGGGRAAAKGGGGGALGRGSSAATGRWSGSVWLLTQEPISATSSSNTADAGSTHTLKDRLAAASLMALSTTLLAPSPATPSCARTAPERPPRPLAR